jgi:hypothetical protein
LKKIIKILASIITGIIILTFIVFNLTHHIDEICDKTLSEEEIKDYFIDIAMYNESGFLNLFKQETFLSKWEKKYTEDGIKVYIFNNMPRFLEEELRIIIDELSSLEIWPIITVEKADAYKKPSEEHDAIYIVYNSIEEFYKISDESDGIGPFTLGYFIIEYLPLFGISEAFIYLKGGLSEELSISALREEFIQVLGLPNDSSKCYDSIFHNINNPIKYSNTDLTLLKILYNDKLISGMRLEEVQEILDKYTLSELIEIED